MNTNFCIKVILYLVMLSMLIMDSYAQNSKESAQKAMESTIIKIGDNAPDFTVEMLDGRLLKLSDMKGKVILINFWATWCGPCMQEFSVIPEKIIKRFKEKTDFVFLPISRGEDRKTVQDKMNQLRRNGIVFSAGLDLDKTIYNMYASMYIPRNFLIGKDGKVVYLSIGYSENEFAELIKKIEELLK